MATCTITGTLKTPSGAVLPYGKVRLVRGVKTGAIILRDPVEAQANASGVITFTAMRASTLYAAGNAAGLNANGVAGVELTIPDAATANLEDLI